MKIRRDIASVPARTAEETWREFISLVTSDDARDVEQLRLATSVMTSLITDEIYDDSPLTLVGAGARLVVYLAFGADALRLGSSATPIDFAPLEGEWTLYVPCTSENLDWAQSMLAERAPRLELHLPETKPAAVVRTKKAELRVDWGAVG